MTALHPDGTEDKLKKKCQRDQLSSRREIAMGIFDIFSKRKKRQEQKGKATQRLLNGTELHPTFRAVSATSPEAFKDKTVEADESAASWTVLFDKV